MLEILSCRSIVPFVAVAALAAGVSAQTVVSYHGVSSATHQSQFNTLSGQGYRIVSLSVAGSLSAPLYSAVWEQVSGPGWLASHDMSMSQYSTFRTNCINQGYRAKLITAAGTTSGTSVFAAVFVADGATVADGHLYSQSTFLATCDTQRGQGRILVAADLWGAGPYVCAVFEPNPNGTVWGCHIDATSSEFNETRAAHHDGGARLAAIGMSENQSYVSVWYDDRVGNRTVGANLTGTGWQNLYNFISPTQYHRTIASGGSGSALRFAGSFAQYRTPLIRLNSTTGVFRSQFAAFDTHVRTVLVDSGARAGALAIAKDGKLVYARGFTRAESGYPVTQPDDVFRIASLTKVFNAIATYKAKDMGLLQLTERPQAVLGVPFTATGFDNVQIRHILEYVSGIRRNYSAAGIASAMSAPLPISVTTGINWLADQPLLFQPPIAAPTTSSLANYSNAAWMLTAQCVRLRSGQLWENFLQTNVFTPLAITRAKVAASSYAQLGVDDVFPHLSWLRTVTTELDTSGMRVSEQFHEDLHFKRTSGGMACSAIDYVRFLSGVFDLQGGDAIVLTDASRADALDPHTFPNNEEPGSYSQLCRAGMGWSTRPNGVVAYKKGGALESATCDGVWRTDGVSFAIFVNIGGASVGLDTLHSLIDGITSWPNVDEFPSYGMPAFPQRPLIEAISPASLANVTTSSVFTVTGKRLDTVIRVNFGSIQITSTSPGDWADGWFEIVSPTQLRIHPPQGRPPTTYLVRLVNPVGASNGENVNLILGSTFRIGAPSTVGNHPFACVIGRGTSGSLPLATGFTILCVSFSNQPSSAPGLVNLGLGNQFTDLLTTGAMQFGLLTSAVRFDFPLLPSGTVYLEAVGFDIAAPSIFPLLTTSTVAVTRQ